MADAEPVYSQVNSKHPGICAWSFTLHLSVTELSASKKQEHGSVCVWGGSEEPAFQDSVGTVASTPWKPIQGQGGQPKQ